MTASSTPTTTASPAVATPQAADNFEANLSYALLNQQSQLREQSKVSKKRGLLILVNGMEHSGKGDAVKALTEWMDARYIKVHATMGQHPSRHQPIWQRHTLQLPRHGEIAIYFGNWYADLIRYVFDSSKHLDNKRLRQMIEDIEAFEQDLVNNHTDIIKCWFSVENKTLKKRLQDANPTLKQLYYVNWFCKKDRQRFYHFGGKLLSLQPHWHHIDGQDITTSNLQFAHIVLGALTRLNQPSAKTLNNQSATNQQSTFRPTALLDALQHPATATIDKTHYKKQLQAKQAILAKLLSQRGQRHIVFVFEGMDAAGKGGAIRRAIAPLDPREYVIHAIAAPTEDELKHPYLWRFWTRLPHDELADVDIEYLSQKFKGNKCLALLKQRLHSSRISFFDRSWYGRVLVERVEGFASDTDWQRAYDEINRFEHDLVQSRAIIVKFWLAISEEEELQRFQTRQTTPNKQFKITDEDWRNRSKWQPYVQAASDMIHLTHQPHSPWYVIATDDKYSARLKVLDAMIAELSKHL